MVKNIIFLDIDEVICTFHSRFAYGNMNALDPSCCMILLRLCEKTNSKIVVHSSWRRLSNGMDIFRDQLEATCPRLTDFVIGCTDPKIYDRVDSIAYWLDMNMDSEQVLDYAIIDDLSLNFYEHEELAAHFHQIQNPYVGIDLYEYMDIERQLNGADN